MKKKLIVVGIFLAATLIGAVFLGWYDGKIGKNLHFGRGNQDDVPSKPTVQQVPTSQPLPTRQNPGCIVVGSEPVAIPIFVPNDKAFKTCTYDGVNYRYKDNTWDQYVYVSDGVTNVMSEKHIFEPVVSLTDVRPGQTARIFYYVE